MKKILSFLLTINLMWEITIGLVACNSSQYNETQLKEIKEKNNIKTNYGILEWITPQEKPFSKADNKWYFIIWKADKWITTKYKNSRYDPNKGWIIEDLPNVKCRLMMRPEFIFGAFNGKWRQWGRNDDISYFKAVYRWNDNSEPNKDVESKLKNYLGLKI